MMLMQILDDVDVDTDDDGPCEDIIIIVKTHNGASAGTHCGYLELAIIN